MGTLLEILTLLKLLSELTHPTKHLVVLHIHQLWKAILSFKLQLEYLIFQESSLLETQDLTTVSFVKFSKLIGVVLETDAIDSTIPSNAQYMSSLGSSSINFPL